ncbi:MAG: hypothetical protein IJJ69_09105 [Oscillospiraceae bacterium]|nr:hypothetical protein [Oscillospiraceae bacterium]
MEYNTSSKQPDCLTDKQIETLRQYIKECPNPYTENDPEIRTLDGELDTKRFSAYYAIKTLTKYGIPFETA